MAVKSVIVADPCADNRESLAELLRLYGFAAETADSLDALLARLRGAPAAAVVTEGFGDLGRTCRAIRDAARGVTVAFHTTRGQPADVRLAMALGCRHFLKASGTADLLGWLVGGPSDGCMAGLTTAGAVIIRASSCPDRVNRAAAPGSIAVGVCLVRAVVPAGV